MLGDMHFVRVSYDSFGYTYTHTHTKYVCNVLMIVIL